MSETVKVTVIATGFDPAAERITDITSVRQSHIPIGLGSSRPIAARATIPPSYSSRPTEKREVPARSNRVSTEIGMQAPRAFGASALHDEAVLDIPAYLRRSATPSE
jgi:hypothetical protein